MKTTSTHRKPKVPYRSRRVDCSFPVKIGKKLGRVKDLSESGIFIEIDDKSLLPNSFINFVIDIDTPGGPIKMNIKGEVVRVQETEGRLGVGVKIIDQITY